VARNRAPPPPECPTRHSGRSPTRHSGRSPTWRVAKGFCGYKRSRLAGGKIGSTSGLPTLGIDLGKTWCQPVGLSVDGAVLLRKRVRRSNVLRLTANMAACQQWGALFDRHDAAVRQQIRRFRGREVKSLGDGFLATFDGPARAVRCASAVYPDRATSRHHCAQRASHRRD
jgi:hypothetical protein